MRGTSLVLIVLLTACADRKPADEMPPKEAYRVSRLLRLAVHLQGLDAERREERLRRLAQDPDRTDDFFPLCRMLFEPKPRAEFRRPMIGMPSFAGGLAFKDWPLEPITIFKGIPISIVRGYALAGYPEEPQDYLEYCLGACDWRRELFAYVELETQRKLIMEFIRSTPAVAPDSEWLLAQAN